MNPVTATTAPAMLCFAHRSNDLGNVFQDVLNSSVELADAQISHSADSVDVSANCIESTSAPAPALLVEAQQWTASLSMLQPQVQTSNAEDTTPLPADEKDAAHSPSNPAPAETASVLLAAVHMPVQGNTATAMPATPATLQSRKKTTDIAATVADGVEAKLARLDKLSNGFSTPIQKELVTDISAKVVAPPSELIRDGAAGLDTRIAIGATASSSPTTAMSGSTSIAELRQLVLTQDGEWIGALARDIASSAARDNHLQFTLMPENLGLLDVAVTMGNDHVDIRLETSTNAAAQIISADQARLVEDLRNAGLKLGQFDMSNRQNGNGQQKPPTPEHQAFETISTPVQPAAILKAGGRYA
ncbi:flagellar hook-length control protein FliK [Sphingorhabdus sp.]|uniref:flagellar hook-length control protein FliK n=1 Tax=Sphingorhabdus sp. TaxID=1902408 RepID=UPI00391DF3A7